MGTEYFLCESTGAEGGYFYCLKRNELLIPKEAGDPALDSEVRFRYGTCDYTGIVLFSSDSEPAVLSKIKDIKKDRKNLARIKDPSFHGTDGKPAKRRAAVAQRQPMHECFALSSTTIAMKPIKVENKKLKERNSKRISALEAEKDICSDDSDRTTKVTSDSEGSSDESGGSVSKKARVAGRLKDIATLQAFQEDSDENKTASGEEDLEEDKKAAGEGDSDEDKKAAGEEDSDEDEKAAGEEDSDKDEEAAGEEDSDEDKKAAGEDDSYEDKKAAGEEDSYEDKKAAGEEDSDEDKKAAGEEDSDEDMTAAEGKEVLNEDTSTAEREVGLEEKTAAGKDSYGLKAGEDSDSENELMRRIQVKRIRYNSSSSDSDYPKRKMLTQKKKTDPAVLKKKTDPAVLKKKTDPALLKKKTDPALLKKKTDPAVLKKKTEPAVLKKKTEPAVLKKKTEPAVLKKKTEPAALIKKTEPALLKMKTEPAVLKKKNEPLRKRRMSGTRNLTIFPGQNFIYSADDDKVVKLHEDFNDVYVQESDLKNACKARSATCFVRQMVEKVYTKEALLSATPKGFPARSKGREEYSGLHAKSAPPRLHPSGIGAIIAKAKEIESNNRTWRPKANEPYPHQTIGTKIWQYKDMHNRDSSDKSSIEGSNHESD